MSSTAESLTSPPRRCRPSWLLAAAAGFFLGASTPSDRGWSVEARPDAVWWARGRTVHIARGVVDVTATKAAAVEAAGARIVVLRGRVVVTCHEEVRLRVERGVVITGGRAHRAGSRLAWVPGADPMLMPWPRGARVAASSSPSWRVPCAGDPVRCRALHAGWERAMQRRLLRAAARGPGRGRHLVLAVLLERGTPAARRAAAGMLSPSEAWRIRDVLRAVGADLTVRAPGEVPTRGGPAASSLRKEVPAAGSADRQIGSEPDLLAHPDVITFAHQFPRRRWHVTAHLLEDLASGDSVRHARAVADASRTRTRAVLDALRARLVTAPPGEVASLAAAVEGVLDRTVDREAAARFGLRHATLRQVETLLPVFQPPGEDLLRP